MKQVCAIRNWMLATVTAAAGLHAQPQPSQENVGVGVARITYISGDVSARHGGRGDIVSAEPGLPLVTGDTLTTGAGARAEVRFDNFNFVRLAANSEIKLRQIGARVYQLDVMRGSAEYTMMKYGEADVFLASPNGSVTPRKHGVYRVDVTAPKQSLVTARKGEAEIMTPDGSVVLKSGKSVALAEPAQKLKVTFPPKKDAFDEWNARRNKMLEGRAGPVYAGGPYPPIVNVGLGWGWGWPFWGGYWGPGWGGFYPRVGVGVGYPVVVRRGGYRRW